MAQSRAPRPLGHTATIVAVTVLVIVGLLYAFGFLR